MNTLLILIMILSWVTLITSVLLMSPKWWLWVWLAWWASWEDYGSKKSIEWWLKKAAIISSAIFFLTVLILPYI